MKPIVKPPVNPLAVFKPRLEFPKYNVTHSNFLGHHRVALQRMRAISQQVDLLVEVRDARAPISTRNGLFSRVFSENTPRVILYSKKDLSPLTQAQVDAWHPERNGLLVDCKSMADVRKVLRVAKALANRMDPPPPLGIKMLVAGMPNVGKSTFLNNIRTAGTSIKTKAAQTGGLAGVTRGISNEIRISSNPSILILDTPGVFVPYVNEEKSMVALAVTGAMRTSIIDPIIQADYLLYRLNLQDPEGKQYREYLPAPTNNIRNLLNAVWSKKLKSKQKGGGFNDVGAAAFWVDHWRQGYEGKLMLDNIEEYGASTKIQEQLLDDFDMDFDEEAKRWKKRNVFE